MGVSLRKAELSDIGWLLVELKMFAEFYASEHSLFSDDDNYNAGILAKIIEDHYFMVSENDGVPSGFIAGMISPHVFNPKILTLTELFWWVKPDFRGSRAGAMLLNDFVKFGDSCQWVIMTLENDSPISSESILKRGFKYKEQSFIKENKVG